MTPKARANGELRLTQARPQARARTKKNENRLLNEFTLHSAGWLKDEIFIESLSISSIESEPTY